VLKVLLEFQEQITNKRLAPGNRETKEIKVLKEIREILVLKERKELRELREILERLVPRERMV